MFPLVTLFGKEIGTYSLCVIAGVLALMLCTWLLARRRGLVPEDEVVVMLVALAGMVVGGSSFSRRHERLSRRQDSGIVRGI